MLKLFFCFLLFFLLAFTANAMQDTKTKQFTTVKTTIAIDWLIGVFGIASLRVRKRKTKRRKQSKLGKWLRNIAGYLMFGIGGIFAVVAFICWFIAAGLANGGSIPNPPLGSMLAFGLAILLLAFASLGLANLFFYFGKLLLKDEGDYSIRFPELH
jgi:hypothetical protein